MSLSAVLTLCCAVLMLCAVLQPPLASVLMEGPTGFMTRLCRCCRLVPTPTVPAAPSCLTSSRCGGGGGGDLGALGMHEAAACSAPRLGLLHLGQQGLWCGSDSDAPCDSDSPLR